MDFLVSWELQGHFNSWSENEHYPLMSLKWYKSPSQQDLLSVLFIPILNVYTDLTQFAYLQKYVLHQEHFQNYFITMVIKKTQKTLDI